MSQVSLTVMVTMVIMLDNKEVFDLVSLDLVVSGLSKLICHGYHGDYA